MDRLLLYVEAVGLKWLALVTGVVMVAPEIADRVWPSWKARLERFGVTSKRRRWIEIGALFAAISVAQGLAWNTADQERSQASGSAIYWKAIAGARQAEIDRLSANATTPTKVAPAPVNAPERLKPSTKSLPMQPPPDKPDLVLANSMASPVKERSAMAYAGFKNLGSKAAVCDKEAASLFPSDREPTSLKYNDMSRDDIESSIVTIEPDDGNGTIHLDLRRQTNPAFAKSDYDNWVAGKTVLYLVGYLSCRSGDGPSYQIGFGLMSRPGHMGLEEFGGSKFNYLKRE